jgi:putative FmdB family regulatory protein
MPIYEFSCPKCSERFELLRSVSQCDEPAPCPECGAVGERMISMFACRSVDAAGKKAKMAGGGSSCGSCSSSSCGSCG